MRVDSDTARRFSGDLLAWFQRHGRHDLPWQTDPTPYRVWVSEVMLQQTQVAAVIPFYRRFMGRFPDLASLAAATVDDVLHHWSGLGYYARARNLHRAARLVRDRHDGRMPSTLDGLMDLPGIGRSTAGAILALSAGDRHTILDGNVKRVLSRYFAVDGWPGTTAVSRELWEIAEALTPEKDVAEYTQAIMDLGATVCTRSSPACQSCPVSKGCLACEQGAQARYPGKRPKRDRPLRQCTMLIVRDREDRVLLVRRPGDGLWGGLWVLPELAPDDDPVTWCRERIGGSVLEESEWAPVRHGFTHFELQITPRVLRMASAENKVMDGEDLLWYNPEAPAQIGLAAIVTKLILRLGDTVDA